MRMSCNGCRILRKGCTEDCTIKPCLDWIKSPDSQANATLFLAKFYGRAGLINLIEAGPPNHRPAVFRSLLYEACGRIVDPVSGSVGLLWSGNWAQCQAAVDAVLRGLPIVTGNTLPPPLPPPLSSSSSATVTSIAPAMYTNILRAYDIRHVSPVADKPTNNKRLKSKHPTPWLSDNANVIVVDDESVESVEGKPLTLKLVDENGGVGLDLTLGFNAPSN